MMRRYCLCLSLLAIAVSANPIQAQAEKGAPDPVALLKELQLQVRKLQDSVDDLKKRIDVTPSEQSVDSQIRKALAGSAVELDALRRQVEQLQRDVTALKSPTRVSAYPTGTGRIRLVNTYPTQMGVIVNSQFYRLAPGEDRMLENQPAGSFTYEVIGAPPPAPGQSWPLTRPLTANETFTITVYPR